jgi:hypothetical protein
MELKDILEIIGISFWVVGIVCVILYFFYAYTERPKAKRIFTDTNDLIGAFMRRAISPNEFRLYAAEFGMPVAMVEDIIGLRIAEREQEQMEYDNE